MMRTFSALAGYSVKCLQQQPTILWKTRDENDFPRVPIVSLTFVSPGVVYCSLAVTNNSPVWSPQGTHGEAYPCITWCSWLFISSD